VWPKSWYNAQAGPERVGVHDAHLHRVASPRVKVGRKLSGGVKPSLPPCRKRDLTVIRFSDCCLLNENFSLKVQVPPALSFVEVL
jgi:hypothetical protein